MAIRKVLVKDTGIYKTYRTTADTQKEKRQAFIEGMGERNPEKLLDGLKAELLEFFESHGGREDYQTETRCEWYGCPADAPIRAKDAGDALTTLHMVRDDLAKIRGCKNQADAVKRAEQVIINAYRLGQLVHKYVIRPYEPMVKTRIAQTAKLKAQSKLTEAQRKEIRLAYKKRGNTPVSSLAIELMERYGVSERTIYRVLGIRKKLC